jgi:hypothetical protein
MSKVIPTSPTIPQLLEFVDGEIIEQADWEDLIEFLHWGLANQPIVLGGQAFPADFETTSTSYATDNEGSSARNLDQVSLTGRMLRELAGGDYQWALHVFGSDIDVQVTTYRLDGGSRTSLGTDSLSITAASKEWADTQILWSEPDILEGGTGGNDPEILALEVEAKTNATTGYIEMWHIQAEKITNASELP